MKRRWGSKLLVGGVSLAMAAGIGVSNSADTHSVAVRLTGTTIGVGPSGDAFGLILPFAFYGTVVPEGDSYHAVSYPAQMLVSIPVISDLPILSSLPYWPHSVKRSETIGAGFLLQDIAATPATDKVTIIGASQGAMVVEVARAAMNNDPEYLDNAANYEFVLIGDPYQPNGGILTRFSYWKNVPVLGDLFPLGRPGPADTAFKTTIYQNQYDPVVDFPAYLNPLAFANAIAGSGFGHAFPGYGLERSDASNAVVTTVGNTTYVMLPQYLPMLAPLRIPASLIGAERFVDAMDPVLRVFIEMAYDREANPSQVQEFSFITPPDKFKEARDALPGAFEQSAAILGGEPYIPTLPEPDDSDVAPSPSTEHPVQRPDTAPAALAVRKAVEDAARSLSNATRPLTKVLQAIGGQTSAASTDDAMATSDLRTQVNAVHDGVTSKKPVARAQGPLSRIGRTIREQVSKRAAQSAASTSKRSSEAAGKETG